MTRVTIFTGPDQLQRINLNGWTGLLRYKWNELGEYWTLDILNVDESVILGTIKLVPGVPLIRNYVNALLPVGDFILLDTEGTDIMPTLDNLGIRYALIFATQEEIDAIV